MKKKKILMIIPLAIAVIALQFASVSAFAVTEGTTISNTLTDTVNSAYDTNTVSLEWSLDGVTYTAGELNPSIVTGDGNVEIWVKATNNTSFDIERVLFWATYEDDILSAEYYDEGVTDTWLPVGDEADDTHYFGPRAGFPMLGSSVAITKFRMIPTGTQGVASVNIWAVQLDAPAP